MMTYLVLFSDWWQHLNQNLLVYKYNGQYGIMGSMDVQKCVPGDDFEAEELESSSDSTGGLRGLLVSSCELVLD